MCNNNVERRQKAYIFAENKKIAGNVLMSHSENPVIVQSDRTLLLEVNNPLYTEARDALSGFAEIVKSPEHFHTYRITPLSLFNAAAAGMTSEGVLKALRKYSRYDVPVCVEMDIADYVSRYGRLRLMQSGGKLILSGEDDALIEMVWQSENIRPFLFARINTNSLEILPEMRGRLKQALLKFGYPAEDLAGYRSGEGLAVSLLDTCSGGGAFGLRCYQRRAVDSFYAGGGVRGGSGTVVLPCGAGKTMVGMGVIAALKCHTLIITPGITACRQWKDELLDKTTLTENEIGEYSGEKKEIMPVTLTTYQLLTYRPGTGGEFPYFALFNSANWGLIIYEEVHLLPAPVFRFTAELQSKRRLGLTATLVREDGREGDVFSLIGPKKYDAPWKDLESQGWIAEALCYEVRVSMDKETRLEYVTSSDRKKYRIAAENPEKYKAVREILKFHEKKKDRILIIGTYLSQLEKIRRLFGAEILTGKTPNSERRELYARFRAGEIRLLVVSRVANFAVDLPEANVAVQISGAFGSRQEEAQRLGRILRPKKDGSPACFYSVVTGDSKDQDFSAKRQLFLIEQGYKYRIENGVNELFANMKG